MKAIPFLALNICNFEIFIFVGVILGCQLSFLMIRPDIDMKLSLAGKKHYSALVLSITVSTAIQALHKSLLLRSSLNLSLTIYKFEP